MARETESIATGGKDVLEVCSKVQTSCAELCHFFADLFKEDRDTWQLWLKTALEDENQARLFALNAKLRRREAVEPVRLELADAELALLYARSVVDRARKTPPSQLEALRIAVDLKKKLEHFSVGNVVGAADLTQEPAFLGTPSPASASLATLEAAYRRLADG